MEKKVVDQKEYLRKYLSSGDGDDKKKKKKKKPKVGSKTVKVIDDDIDLKNMRPMDENEFDIFLDGEDAPQIAGVVDERGPVDFTDKRRWKIVSNNEDGDLTITSHSRNIRRSEIVSNNSDNDLSLPRSKSNRKHNYEMHARQERAEDNDLSPPRRKSKKTFHSNNNSDSDSQTNIPSCNIEKKARRKKGGSDSDLSPPRRNKKEKLDKTRKQVDGSDSDLSPPRKSRKDPESDLSPPRRKKNKNYDSDLSPPRKQKKGSDSDLSPPRRHGKHRDNKQKNKNDDFDLSPPRHSKKQKDARYNSKKGRHSDSDQSPPRKNKYRQTYDNSHKDNRKHKHSDDYSRPNRRYDSGSRPPYRKDRESESSSSRSRKDERDSYTVKRSRWHDESHLESEFPRGRDTREESRVYANEKRRSVVNNKDSDEDHGKRMKKTLDGKKAGLQDATSLREETEAHRIREAEQFSKLSKEVTGVGQAVVLRDSKTGKRRNLHAEAAEEREKQKRQTELDEKYVKWGTGLKQVEDREEKLMDDLYEMSKPLARYADDADLDKRLRDQDREGDPMLEYIKQKQIKEGKRKPDRPTYDGSFMPNRFGIKPGHRWDGVDRSNGYEKRWFESQNAKVARQEEAYKWSTADM